MSPGIPALREAVAENDQWALPRLGEVHPDAVRLDETLVYPSHKVSFRKSAGRITGRTARPSAFAIVTYLTEAFV
jgi:hypothetical protein